MANYLNSIKPFSLFKSERAKPYFVDKSLMIEELYSLVQSGGNYLCITRPRRFGKTLMATMLAAYFEKGRESEAVFNGLKIAESEHYKEYLNQYDVIYIAWNEIPKGCVSYEQYMNRICSRLVKDLVKAYPDCEFDQDEALWDILNAIYDETERGFLFIFDEWDYIFHKDFVTGKDKEAYMEFLSNLLKGQPYVLLAYMTGILPIAKYSSGSELNMFLEYTMASEAKYSMYFGFTDAEVDDIYQRFLCVQQETKVTREELRTWYDGYYTISGERVYNPRSVVAALVNNNPGNYWTSSGPYDEIFYYIRNNVDAVKDDLALMISGIPVCAKAREYAAVTMNLSTRDEIFSAMIVYGFLSYHDGKVMIPNKELMDRFGEMIQKESSLGYVYRLARESERMLKATKAGDINTMVEILEYAHDTEVPLLNYNNEQDLTAVVNLVYLAARDTYRVEREDKAGIGYVDFIFYPENKMDDCMIIELKVDHTPEEAIQQIKKRRYALRFKEKFAGSSGYTGRILAIGIAYDRKSKKHSCRIEELLRD